MNSFISACVIPVLGFLTSERSAAVFILALPFRPTRPDLEIPAHSPPDIDRVPRERARFDQQVAGLPEHSARDLRRVIQTRSVCHDPRTPLGNAPTSSR